MISREWFGDQPDTLTVEKVFGPWQWLLGTSTHEHGDGSRRSICLQLLDAVPYTCLIFVLNVNKNDIRLQECNVFDTLNRIVVCKCPLKASRLKHFREVLHEGA